jgi:hypothetical protein
MHVTLLLVFAAPYDTLPHFSAPKDSTPKACVIVQVAFLAKLMEHDAKDSDVLKLQKERARDRVRAMAKIHEAINSGDWNAADLGLYVKEQRLLWENLSGLATRPVDKLKCAEMRLEAVKEFEKFITARVEVGSDPSQNQDFVKAARLDAEIDLLKLKDALKAKK